MNARIERCDRCHAMFPFCTCKGAAGVLLIDCGYLHSVSGPGCPHCTPRRTA